MAKIFEHDESRTKERRKHGEARTHRSYRTAPPVTPIPRRASASSPGSVGIRVRHPRSYTDVRDGDFTRLPTVPQSATWQGEADEYEEENNLPPEFSPFLHSSPSIDELDTVPPDDRQRDIAPARLTDYGAPSDVYNLGFPLDISEPAQQVQAGVQFPLEINKPLQLHETGPHFPLEIDNGQRQRSGVIRFPLEIDEDHTQGNVNTGFPLEIDEDHAQGNINAGIGEVVQSFGNQPSFPIVWSDARIHLHEVRNASADICEQVTNPPPAPVQPHSELVLQDEPPYIDAVVEADTAMDDTLIVVPSLSTDIALYETSIEDVVDIALTARAKELLRRKSPIEAVPAFIHNPLDYLRWWLLSPGRLEFLFWLGGALLLGVIMCVALVMMGLGLGFMSFGHIAH